VIVTDHHVRKHHAKDVEKGITYQICWTLHPEKAPRRLRQKTPKATADDQKTESLSKELVLQDSKQSNQANLVIDSQSRTPEWFLDTTADVHTTCLWYAYTTFCEIDALIDDAGKHPHRVKRVGTISLYGIEIPNVRYIPTMQVNLLSFRQLDKQNFNISLTGNVSEKRFLIKSPTGASLDTYADDCNEPSNN
jgi:hypothetical protein